MNTALMMVSYKKDFEFATFACQSTHKFATGFSDKLIVVPHEDVEKFSAMAVPLGFRVEGFDERPGKGMLHHMAIICEADLWLPEADAVLIQDSDCVFLSPVSPADYLTEDKPIIFRDKFERFKNYSERYSWKQCVFTATGINPEWECMCRHPLLHLVVVLKRTREIIGQHTRQDWKEYILAGRNKYPQTFTEFPTLGAVAIEHFPELHHFVDWPFEGQPAAKLKDFWSHGGVDFETDRHPGKTARQCIQEILG